MAAVVSALVAAGALAGCTGDDEKRAEAAPTEASSEAVVEPQVNVRVTRVAGRLPAGTRAKLADAIGKQLQSYVDAAFLGDYPRSDFSGSFGVFTRTAARTAAKDQALLTGASLGEATSVRAESLKAYLAVLAPRGRAAGATARVDLRFTTDLAGHESVRLVGRLLFSPEDGGWQIFGYDVARSDEAAGES